MFATNINSVFTCRVLSYRYVSLESELVWGVGYIKYMYVSQVSRCGLFFASQWVWGVCNRSVKWVGLSCLLQVSQVSGCGCGELFVTSQLNGWVWMWGVVCYKSAKWVGVDVRSCLLQVSQVNRLEGVVCYKLVERIGVDVRSCLLQVS